MKKESIHIDDEVIKKPSKINEEPVVSGMSIETKLVIASLVLFFIAVNVWGFYFYKKSFFNISADVTQSTLTPKIPIEKSDSVYMIPGI